MKNENWVLACLKRGISHLPHKNRSCGRILKVRGAEVEVNYLLQPVATPTPCWTIVLDRIESGKNYGSPVIVDMADRQIEVPSCLAGVETAGKMSRLASKILGAEYRFSLI